jgi:uncharacterized membrane protein YfcA
MTGSELAILVVAGIGAGLANTVAGGGTFVSYPVLVSLGLSPIGANVTSAVGLISGYVGGSLSYRRELVGQRERFLRMVPAALAGSVTGALLLLSTPGATFDALVPYLVLSATLMLVAQPHVKRWVLVRRTHGPRSTEQDVGIAAHVGIFLGAVYGTYFGAGLGVVLLAVLGALILDDLQRLNGLRTVQSLMIKLVGVAIFVFSGQVDWLVAAILAVAAYGGGTLGAVVTRRMTEGVLRGTVIGCGLFVFVYLLLG